MTGALVRYQTDLVDSARWQRLRLRSGDIVISTPPKCGTTWIQMICALLIFQTAELPAPLSALSPWLDLRLRPFDDIQARLEAQRHRRFLKTHTPLDGIPNRPDVSYLVIGRDPRDAAVSLYHHLANINHAILHQRSASGFRSARTLREFLLAWMGTRRIASLEHVARHLTTAWCRRRESNTILVHYHDLSTDLDAEMKRLAAHLSISVPAQRWPSLVEAATFERMKARAAELAPVEILLDGEAFFRSGSSGQWREVLTAADLARYRQRIEELVPPDLAAWLHADAVA
jgi:aryl sulfotransferase